MAITLEAAVQNYIQTQEFQELEQKFGNQLSQLQILKALRDETGLSRLASIKNVLKYKTYEICPDNLRIYLLCLCEIKDLITKRIIETEYKILAQKMNEVLFMDSLTFSEKNQVSIIVATFFKNFKDLLQPVEEKRLFIASFDQKIVYLNQLKLFIESLQIEGIEGLDEWKKTISSIFSDIKFNMDPNTVDEFWSYTEKFSELKLKNFEKKQEAIEFINSCKDPNNFPVLEPILKQIDEEIIFSFFNYDFNDEDASKIVSLSTKILVENKAIFKQSKRVYCETLVNTIPDTQVMLLIFLKRFLKAVCKLTIRNFFRNEHKRGVAIMYMRNQVRIIFRYPLNVQYAIGEVLTSIEGNEKETTRYLFKNLNRIKASKIDLCWAQDFILAACNPPFREILENYNTQKIDLEVAISRCTYDITLMDLPKFLAGLTLRNNNIVIKYFDEDTGSKGATFFVYLHELANYLQKVNCRNIEENRLIKSQDNNFGIEAGKHLEETYFGGEQGSISEEAAEFLTSGNVPSTVAELTSEFIRLNEDKKGKARIELKQFGNSIYLGYCGFRTKIKK